MLIIRISTAVQDALYMSRKGMGAKEIKKELEKKAFDASIYICVHTLKYLKQSGRVTAAGASLATAMNLHPVLNIRGGKLDAQVEGREAVQVDTQVRGQGGVQVLLLPFRQFQPERT